MPLRVSPGHPSILIRRDAWERCGLTRAAVDARLELTDEEFRVEGQLVCIGPIFATGDMHGVISDMEAAGLVYFDDFFELSGNWPAWLTIHAGSLRGA